MKELPKMYRSKIDKVISNNEKMFSTMMNNDIVVEDRKSSSSLTVEQKIANIFNSPNYIYKIDVEIVTDRGTTKKRIVGKTSTNLITMDSEYIPINTIRDIRISK